MSGKYRFAVAFISFTIGLLLAAALSSATYRVGPFGVRLAWSPAFRSDTNLVFPPLGSVSAKTHRGFVRLSALLESVDLDGLQQAVEPPIELKEAVHPFIKEAQKVLTRWVGRSLLIATLAAGLLTVGLTAPFSRHGVLLGGLKIGGLTAAVLALLGIYSWATFSLDAFQRPIYRGPLQSVPWLIDAVQEGLAKSAMLEERLASLSRSLYQMYERIEGVVPPLTLEEADVVVLHVTDFHNHPSAARITDEFARAFRVDFIVNTGDLTEYGTFLETDLLKRLEKTPVPHYFVSGNHESPELLERIALVESVTLLDGREVTQSGLRLLGVGDPGASSYLAYSLSAAEARRMAQQLNESLKRMAQAPDIVAIHNFRVAESIEAGLVPLVLYGHSHTPGVFFRAGTAYVNAGTTGGAGVRGIEATDPVRISLAVVYLQTSGGGSRVIAVDLIRLSPYAGGFSLERFLAPIPEPESESAA